jgi:septal ring factor EnvC (AmiA/AmiB activator)
MDSFSRRTYRMTLGIALLAGLLAATTAAPDGDDPREAALARIRGEISRLEGQLARLKTKESGLEAELERTRLELDLQEQQLAEATAAFELAATRAAAAEVQVAELEAALAGIRDDLRRRLVGLYRLGRQGYLRLFLALTPERDLLPAIRQLRFLSRRDQMALDRYAATRDELDRERRRLESQRGEMEAWKAREAERHDQLVVLRRRQERLLEEVARERRDLAARTDELQDKERKLARFIYSLVDEKPLEGTPIQEFRGVLDWPAVGQVVGRFGPRRDPRYRTEVPHNGIDVAIDGESREVHVVYPGEVLFASEFEGYGRMVVVHHPGRTFTLYSGLGEVFVEKGDVVSLGAVIGIGADRLYFEIRRENEAEDPLLWLR